MRADRVERILHPHGGDRREASGDRLEQRVFLRRRAAVRIGQRREMGMRRAAKGAGRIRPGRN